jgi:hypothetical protein
MLRPCPIGFWRLFAIVAILAIPSPALAADDGLPLTEGTTVRFATKDEAIAILTASDEFSSRLSKFDLQVRLKTDGDVSLDALRTSVAKEVLAWPEDNQKQVREAVEAVRPQLEKLRLPLPKEVVLVHTTGVEESGAAYTRANAIVFPRKVLRYPAPRLQSLFLHELFHVLSRNDRAVRRELYKIVGFELVPEIELPPSLKDRKITNPDAPAIDCVMELEVDGKRVQGAPILYATPANYDAKKEGSLFQYLTFRLLVVESRDGRLQAVMHDDQPTVLDPRKLDAFYEKIGRNTDYVIHPDEILADNFVFLVTGRKDLKTPRIVDAMARVLGK